VFRNRVAHISATTMLDADQVLRRFFQAATSKTKTPVAQPQGAAPMPPVASASPVPPPTAPPVPFGVSR
jgi:hypothetical protein